MYKFLKKTVLLSSLSILIISCSEEKETHKLDSNSISTVEFFDNSSASAQNTSFTAEQLKQNITSRIRNIPQSYSEEELKLIDVINQYRNSLGLANLSKEIPSYFVRDLALSHNLNMIMTQTVSHNGFADRANQIANINNWGIQRSDFSVGVISEIIAYNYNTPESVLNGWINSPSHKAAIIDSKITQLGLSVTTDSSNGRKYYTVLFVETNAIIRI